MTITLPQNNFLLEEVYNSPISFVDDEIHITNNNNPKIVDCLKEIYGNDVKIRYIAETNTCPICNAEIGCNGTKTFNLNKKHIIKKQKYYCKNKACQHYFTTKTDKFIPIGCNYTFEIQTEGLIVAGIAYSSYEKKSELINHYLETNISRQTIYYHINKRSEEYLIKKEKEVENLLKNLNIEPTGVYHYDEQVIWVNGEIYFRMTILDAGNNMIISDIIIFHENFSKETVNSFLKSALRGLPLDAIVTDGDRSYPTIIDALGAIQQKCVFHKMQNLMKKVYKKLRILKRTMKNCKDKIEELKKQKQKLKGKKRNKKGRISNKDKKREKLKKQLDTLKNKIKETKVKLKKAKKERDELEKNVERISNIFKSKTVKSAERKFNTLYNKVEHLPNEIQSFIKNLSRDLNRTLNHIIDDKIPNTNNKLEGYYKITLPRYLKKIYRTEKGLNIKLRLNRIRWTERNVIQRKIASTS